MRDMTSVVSALSHREDIADSLKAFFMNHDLRTVTSMYQHILESDLSDKESDKFLEVFISTDMVKNCFRSSLWEDAADTIAQLCAYSNMIDEAIYDEDLTNLIRVAWTTEIGTEIDDVDTMIKVKTLLVLQDFLEFADSSLSIRQQRELNKSLSAKIFRK
tara:strand:- start:2145 stop:2624 length:480 start_codon:yes stop_codon:yes gene_type:complete